MNPDDVNPDDAVQHAQEPLDVGQPESHRDEDQDQDASWQPQLEDADMGEPSEQASSEQTFEDERPQETPPEQPEHAEQPVAPERLSWDGPPIGICRADADGLQWIDGLAGRDSVFGFGFAPLAQAIRDMADDYLGQHESGSGEALAAAIGLLLDESSGVIAESIWLCPSADLAIETAIDLVRTHQSQNAESNHSSGTHRYRTIALVNSDHGRTGVCRTASGKPELHQDYGPMMAGFAHVPAEDLDALASAIDDQTAAILISPVALDDAARPLSADYLQGVRDLCDHHSLVLIVDETRLVLGATGKPLTLASIAPIRADLVAVSAGLFGGMPGALLLGNPSLGNLGPSHLDLDRYPMIAAIAASTIGALVESDTIAETETMAQDFAVELAERIAGFEFIRDINAVGMTIGIETDLPSESLVTVARRHGLGIEAAGETSIRIQPPLSLSDDERETLLRCLVQTLQATEVETAQPVA